MDVMAEGREDLPLVWWTEDLEEVDREIARLALACEIKSIDRQIVRRIQAFSARRPRYLHSNE